MSLARVAFLLLSLGAIVALAGLVVREVERALRAELGVS